MKMPVSDDCHAEVIDYRQRYRSLKRKFRCVIFENESFEDELKKAQRKLLKLTQDKSFLLDRLLQYERIEDSSSDSDVTISSDSDLENFAMKKKKMPTTVSTGTASTTSNLHSFSTIGAHSSTTRNPSTEPAPKRKKVAGKVAKPMTPKPAEPKEPIPLSQGDGHMTSEEIERHLESRQILIDLLPERAPPTVPTEMFSNDPSSLESEFNDPGAETSPSNIGDGFIEEDSLIIDLPDQDGCM